MSSAAGSTEAPFAGDTAPRAGLFAAVALVAAKDVRLEWRSRARLNATLFFGVLTLLLFSFAAGPSSALLAANAPGYLWLAIVLSSVLGLGESMRHETEADALEAMRLMPVSPRALFLGKALTNAALLVAMSIVLVPIAVALYDVRFVLGLGPLMLVLVLGALAISAPGTLYAAIAAQARARDVLLPLLLFPVIVPGLLASVRATGLVIEGDPMGQLRSWLWLLVAFDVLYWTLCAALFSRVIEE